MSKKNNRISEATSSGGGTGKFQIPLQPGVRIFDKTSLEPYTIPVSKYNDALLAYDSYDGKMDEPKKVIKKVEAEAEKVSINSKKHPVLNDDDGDILNNNYKVTENLKNRIVSILNEDLGVWFGTKKKPKGSKQPKGPWVNICRKDKNGKHPPCGRPEASDKSYPKCRAAGVAGKMSDSQKKSACSQKRKAEKSHNKSGTGNAPKMVSYKPKKTNEEIKRTVRLTETQLINMIKRVINEQNEPSETDLVNVNCWGPKRAANFTAMRFVDLKDEMGRKVLYLEPSSNVNTQVYSTQTGGEIQRFVFDKDPNIANSLGLGGDGYFLKHYAGGEKWCFVNFPNTDRNKAWEEFTQDYNILTKSFS
jgi:hypothetical protein